VWRIENEREAPVYVTRLGASLPVLCGGGKKRHASQLVSHGFATTSIRRKAALTISDGPRALRQAALEIVARSGEPEPWSK
jgi:hypothetical protein